MPLISCFRNAIGRSAIVLAFGLLMSPVSAWATAEEEQPQVLEGFNALSMASEPMQVSENINQPYRPADANQRQIAMVASYINTRNRSLPSDEVNGIAQAIVSYSNRYGVDYRLVTSLISVESSFRRDAVSSAGAIGMGQLKPDTAKWLGVMDPYDPVDNIAGTVRFLAWLVRKYNGNLESALSAYYQGPGFVDRNGVTDVCMPYLEKINRALIGLI